MFHFPSFPPCALCVQALVTGHYPSWVSPFGHPRITARLTAPRGLSQPPTSFIGSWYQGIHHVLLKTYTQPRFKKRRPRINKDARVHYADLKQQTQTNPHTRQPEEQPQAVQASASQRDNKQQPVPSGPNSAPTTPHHQPRPVPPPQPQQGHEEY